MNHVEYASSWKISQQSFLKNLLERRLEWIVWSIPDLWNSVDAQRSEIPLKSWSPQKERIIELELFSERNRQPTKQFDGQSFFVFRQFLQRNFPRKSSFVGRRFVSSWFSFWECRSVDKLWSLASINRTSREKLSSKKFDEYRWKTFFVEFQNSINDLHRSIMRGDIGRVAKILKYHRPVPIYRNEKGSTPAHHAIEARKFEICALLLERFPSLKSAKDLVSRFEEKSISRLIFLWNLDENPISKDK